jgi:hypothetical protein
MLYLRMFTAEVGTDTRESVERVLESLASEQLRPVLRPALSAAAQVLGLEPLALRRSGRAFNELYEPASNAVTGELFTDGHSLFVLTLLAQNRQRQVFTVRRSLSTPPESGEQRYRLSLTFVGPAFDSATLSAVLREVEAGTGITLAPYAYPLERFEALKAEGRDAPPEVTSEELMGAQKLRDRAMRSLAVSIKASGGLLVRDVPKQLPSEIRDTGDTLIAALKLAGLVDSEIVVVCSKTQAQITRAPSRTKRDG